MYKRQVPWGLGAEAKIQITFEPLEVATSEDSEVPVDTWASYKRRASAEFQTIPSRFLQWKDTADGVSEDANYAIIVPNAEHEIDWHRVKRPPYQALSRLKGTVNASSIKLPGYPEVFERGTLMFLEDSESVEIGADGTQSEKTLSYVFAERNVHVMQAPGDIKSAHDSDAIGWNHLFRERTKNADDETLEAGWYEVESADGKPPYAYADFRLLFREG